MAASDIDTEMTVRTSGKTRFGASLVMNFALALIISWGHRIAAALIYYGNSSYAWHFQSIDGLNPFQSFFNDHATSILLGLKTDALFAAALAVPMTLLGRVGRYVGLLIICFFYAANLEHIKYNEANIDLSLLGLATDPTFIAGQFTVDLIIYFIGLLAVSGLVIWYARHRAVRKLIGVFAVVAALVAILAPVTARYDRPIWLQTHSMMPRIGIPELPEDARQFAVSTLQQSAESLTDFSGQYNVLLVFLEGLSEYSLTKYQMQNVQTLADENIHFRQYIGHQLLTANGIYSTHTGRMPYFTNVPMRWYELNGSAPETTDSLPFLLGNRGYQTAFVQAAPLSFMQKDEKLPLLGYETIIGSGQITAARQRNGWGVDDLSLFDATLAQIDQFSPERPWFASVLTTGTHSPYNVPPDFQASASTDRHLASIYADYAVGELMKGLEARGLIENTVVIITSDESREYSRGTPLEIEAHRNWLPFVMIHPSEADYSIDTPFAMMDARDMILAATGDVSKEELERIAARRDTIIFGNVRLGQLFYYDRPNETFFSCDTADFICFEYGGVTDIRSLENIELRKLARFSGMERMFRQREGDTIYCEDDIAICEEASR
ncbi:LTA synthase family protein [Yoonia sp. 2307UL14-13]|uniref:LTA synthase family protein n=1 Tax=Yoonia sp. 2307UL14-13 TaxID=3126506 RepID=UPI00309BBC0B